MKIFILFIISSFLHYSQAQIIQFGQKEYPKASVWVDPVGSANEDGLHVGVDIQMTMNWGWVGGSISNFSALNGGYTDLVGSGGINLTLFRYTNINYYTGPRLGVIFREGNPFPLIGGTAGFDIRVSNSLLVGLRAWADYRADQANQFYGDSDGYTPGFITNSPLIQENGAIVISFSW